jgi:hypothetical protein
MEVSSRSPEHVAGQSRARIKHHIRDIAEVIDASISDFSGAFVARQIFEWILINFLSVDQIRQRRPNASRASWSRCSGQFCAPLSTLHTMPAAMYYLTIVCD